MKNTTHTMVAIVGIAGVVGSFAGNASADPMAGPGIIISQAPGHGGVAFSDVSMVRSIADDFIVGDGGASLGMLTWYGAYISDNVAANDSFTIRIHADGGGLPDGGAAFLDLSGVAADTRTITGIDLFGYDEYAYTFDLGGLNLDADTYWLEIFNNTQQSRSDWGWEGGNSDPLNGRNGAASAAQTPGINWSHNQDAMAFTINTVPAPGSLALLGLAGCASTHRRRR